MKSCKKRNRREGRRERERLRLRLRLSLFRARDETSPAELAQGTARCRYKSVEKDIKTSIIIKLVN